MRVRLPTRRLLPPGDVVALLYWPRFELALSKHWRLPQSETRIAAYLDRWFDLLSQPPRFAPPLFDLFGDGIGFVNGRHRTCVLAAAGATAIPAVLSSAVLPSAIATGAVIEILARSRTVQIPNLPIVSIDVMRKAAADQGG